MRVMVAVIKTRVSHFFEKIRYWYIHPPNRCFYVNLCLKIVQYASQLDGSTYKALVFIHHTRSLT